MTITIHAADCRTVLPSLPQGSVRCCVTSPPYYLLRDYGVDGQIGLEASPEDYVEQLVALFRQVRRVLANDGTLWLNLGDTYAQGGRGGIGEASTLEGGRHNQNESRLARVKRGRTRPTGYKPKDLIGIPWMVAFALRADGWHLRADVIWHKPSVMPESVLDRPTRAHEYVFLLAKSRRYFYDAASIREPDRGLDHPRRDCSPVHRGAPRGVDAHRGIRKAAGRNGAGRNKRDVWTIATEKYDEAHYATFPPALVEPCILAGSTIGDTILDPFAGSGTTGMVADRLCRHAILIDLNPAYAEQALNRVRDDAPLFVDARIANANAEA